MAGTVSDSIINCILKSNFYSKNCFVFCKTCQRSFNYVSKNFAHICGNKKPSEAEQQTKKPVIRKQNLDLNKHCGVIIGPSGVPCMRSLTCKSHSMTSKRAVKNRIKDFDVLLNEYLQSHPPKSIPKTVSAAVNLDLMTTTEDDSADVETFNFHAISPLNTANSLIINNCVNDKEVALTFEDGPSIKTTKNLLDLLDSLEIKSTFHVVTKHFNFDEVKSLMTEIIDRGHVLGYRLEAEWTMQDVSPEGIQGAVDYRLEMIRKATGKKPKFVRTSYNATDLVKNALLASALIVTIPNFETYDYTKEFNTQDMIKRFDSLSLRSAITVQREFADNLFDTTKLFVEHLRSNGYKIVTLQDCTGIDEIYFEDKSISPLVTHTIDNEIKTEISMESTSTSSASTTKKISNIFQFVLASLLILHLL